MLEDAFRGSIEMAVHLLFNMLIQTFKSVTRRNHDCFITTSLDLPLTLCFSFAGSVVKARGVGT